MPQTGSSIYIHVPFCTKKCAYCNFYVIPDQERYKQLYLSALKQEFIFRPPPSDPVSIYFGGGTPSLLGSDKISEILSLLNYNPSTCEITLEANPEHLTKSLMQEYANTGINRVSLGVQSFDNKQLIRLTRSHTATTAESAIENTLASGIENISIDLMYDLPLQTLESWQQSLIKATSLPIRHLSLYNLTIEPHTSFGKNPPTQPTQELSLQMLELAISHLEAHNFKRYEISAFAHPGYESKHNIGYWTGRPFLGYGPSAFSYWNGARFRNISNLNRYARALNAAEDPVDFTETLPKEEQERERLAIELRLMRGVKPSTLLDPLIKEGFCEHHENRVRLTEKGKLFYDSVGEMIITC